MKRLLPILWILLLPVFASAQNDSVYQTLLARAGLLHLQKSYKGATLLYDSAFQRYRCTDAYELYKAAGAYALDSSDDKALSTLHEAITAGFTETDLLSFDPYFNGLRSRCNRAWKRVQKKAAEAERKHEEKLTLPQIRKQVNLMALTDQQLRYRQAQATDKAQRRILAQQIQAAGVQNTRAAAAMIQRYGWPGISAITILHLPLQTV